MTDVCRQVRVVICEWLAWLLRIKRPGRELGFQDILRKQRVRRLEALIPPSASLISNVKDIDNTIPLSSRQSSDRENVEAQPAAADSCPPYQLAASRPLFYGFVSYAKISDDLSRVLLSCSVSAEGRDRPQRYWASQASVRHTDGAGGLSHRRRHRVC